MPDLSTLTIYDWLGFLGVVSYVGNYLALQLGLLRGTSYPYILLNILAAGLVLISLLQDFNMSSMIIQITWIAISCIGIARRIILARLVRFSPDEAAFVATKFPGIEKELLRPFLRAGHWVEAPSGTRLAELDTPVGALLYLAQGSAEATSGSKLIGTIGPGSFIGELTCFDGSPATATVTTTTPARYFIIPTEPLNQVCRKAPEFHRHLENVLGADTRSKLRAANARLIAETAGMG